MEPIYMNISSAAKRYGVGRDLIYDLIRLPDSPPVIAIGAKRLMNIKDWDEYIANFNNAREGIA